jgi:Protein of unknown function (DUF1439)
MISLTREHKQSLFLSVIIILFFAGCHYYINIKGVQLTIPESKIQEAFSANMPLVHTYDNGMDITFDNPKISLDESNKQIIISMVTTIAIPKTALKVTGAFEATSTIYYAPASKAFFAKNISLRSLTLLKLSGNKLATVKNALEEVANHYYATHPIYVLNDKDRSQILARYLLKQIEIRNHAIIVTLG